VFFKSIGLVSVATLLIVSPSSAEETFRPLKGPYMGQQAGDGPAIFLPGKISTGNAEGCSVFLPGARSFLWRVVRGEESMLLLLEDVDGRWQPPRQVSLVADRGDVWDFTLSGDGRDLYFTSDVPLDGAARGNLWAVRVGAGDWGEPLPLGPSINTDWHEGYPSIGRDGVLYFFRRHPEDRSVGDIYSAEPGDDGFDAPVRLAPPVNSDALEYDPFIAADGSFLIFSSQRPGGHGQGDLYASFRDDRGKWGEPVNLGPQVNSSAEENRPAVTLDGKYFFFTSDRKSEVRLPPGVPPASSMPGEGSRDIYWMRADFIRKLRPKVSRN
jgi:hypothetical protein